MGFLPNPYVILAALVLWLGSCGVAFWKGYQYADQSAEVALLKTGIVARDAVIAKQKQDAALSAEIARHATERSDTAEAETAAATSRLEELEAHVNDLPPAPSEPAAPGAAVVVPMSGYRRCVLGSDGVRWLDAIGTPRHPPQSPATPH